MEERKWYVLHTKPQKEQNVYQLLERGGFEAFFPRLKTFSLRIKPLFPSYLFVHLNLDNFEESHTIRYTRGVNKLIGAKEGPVAISDDVIEIIRSRVGEGGYLEQGSLLKSGDRVLVKRGVLRDLVGILEKPIDDKGRVEVLFKIVRHQMRAKVYVSDLEKM